MNRLVSIGFTNRWKSILTMQILLSIARRKGKVAESLVICRSRYFQEMLFSRSVWNVDCGLQIADCGPEVKWRLSVKCRMRSLKKRSSDLGSVSDSLMISTRSRIGRGKVIRHLDEGDGEKEREAKWLPFFFLPTPPSPALPSLI